MTLREREQDLQFQIPRNDKIKNVLDDGLIIHFVLYLKILFSSEFVFDMRSKEGENFIVGMVYIVHNAIFGIICYETMIQSYLLFYYITKQYRKFLFVLKKNITVYVQRKMSLVFVVCTSIMLKSVYNKVVENSTSWDSLKLKRKPLP